MNRNSNSRPALYVAVSILVLVAIAPANEPSLWRASSTRGASGDSRQDLAARSGALHAGGEGAWVTTVPINPYGLSAAPYPEGTAIDGNMITVPDTPMRLWLELRAGGWAPDKLKTIQCEIDASTYANGDGDPLAPPVVECTDSGEPPHAMCEAAFGRGARCRENVCTYGFIDGSRKDLVLYGGKWGVDVSGTNPRFGSTLSAAQPAATDNGQPYYTGTLVIDIPAGAAGIYTIRMDVVASSMRASDGGQIALAQEFPAIIRIAEGCCIPGDGCLNVSPEMCADAGGVLGHACVGDCDANGIDDACDGFDDCNGNGRPDRCELSDGTEADCNDNGILDSCDIVAGRAEDCDGNGVIDLCEDPSGTARDCNVNGVLDACDITSGRSTDDDGNCIPDECDAAPPPLVEPAGVLKSRFISFETVNAGCETAIRVKLVSLNHPDPANAAGIPESDFSAFEGEYRWVGPPEIIAESANPATFFTAAKLQCEPHFMDWSSVGLIHLYGTAIVPSSFYEVQFVDAACANWNGPACGMRSLTINTGRWGDVVAPFHTPDGATQPDFSDIAAVGDKFTRLPFPLTASAELGPNLPNVAQFIDFNDVSAAVDAFTGGTYPFTGPNACP